MTFPRARCRRALVCLLLCLIVYGATADAAHSHGVVAPDRSGAVNLIDAGGSQSSDVGDSRHRECSMCQFQQQLFGGLVHAPFFARTPQIETAFVSTLTVLYFSTSTTPRSGRAPPLV
ncbi:MAG: hypothetical protein M3R68_09900 [Acidobacteriota bacterium]|nr:hypothetical protein [Acidobacteriota bacterium]